MKLKEISVAAKQAIFYINGKLDTLINLDPAITKLYQNATQPFVIGNSEKVYTKPLGGPLTISAEYYVGAMDELRIWNVARSASQINATMNCHLNGDETGLVSYYTFAGSTVSQVIDYGTHNLNCIIVNASNDEAKISENHPTVNLACSSSLPTSSSATTITSASTTSLTSTTTMSSSSTATTATSTTSSTSSSTVSTTSSSSTVNSDNSTSSLTTAPVSSTISSTGSTIGNDTFGDNNTEPRDHLYYCYPLTFSLVQLRSSDSFSYSLIIYIVVPVVFCLIVSTIISVWIYKRKKNKQAKQPISTDIEMKDHYTNLSCNSKIF